MQDDTKHSGDVAKQAKINSTGPVGLDQTGTGSSLNKEAEPIGTGEYLTPSSSKQALRFSAKGNGMKLTES